MTCCHKAVSLFLYRGGVKVDKKQDQKGRWVTIKGHHVFIPEGKSSTQVLNEYTYKKQTEAKKEEPGWKEGFADVMKRGAVPKILVADTPEDMRAQYEYIQDLYPQYEDDDNGTTVQFNKRGNSVIASLIYKNAGGQQHVNDIDVTAYITSDKARAGFKKWWYWSMNETELKKIMQERDRVDPNMKWTSTSMKKWESYNKKK